jgi:hypothetical protein
MNFYPSRFLAHIAFGAVVATAFSAAAQQTILFSKPAENPEDKSTSFMLDSGSKLKGRAGEFNAPKALFNLAPEPDLLPPPTPVMPDQSLRDSLNKRKNWTLMTPEEILGVPTAEKILGLPDPTGDDQRTPEERFLHRQGLAASFSATNALRRPDGALLRDDANPFAPPREADGENDAFAKPDPRLEAGNRKYFDRLVNGPARADVNAGLGVDQKQDSDWPSSFSQSTQPTKQDLDQIAAMERFRALMEPSAAPEKPTAQTRFAPAPVLPPDPNLQPLPLFNPLGQSYTPLQISVGRPTGIMPLPGLTGPYPSLAAPKKPLVQLPPWLSKDPPPFDSPFGQVNTRTW